MNAEETGLLRPRQRRRDRPADALGPVDSGLAVVSDDADAGATARTAELIHTGDGRGGPSPAART